ncbi:hypothetical protein [Streptomyces sp. NPDC048496]|uniref:hypothetical protein n=1 Tax=Streptomyces sp. NPDC048496 TaxID=3365558 RepID=UPI00371E2558
MRTTAPADRSQERWRRLLRFGRPGTAVGEPDSAYHRAVARDLREASKRSAA